MGAGHIGGASSRDRGLGMGKKQKVRGGGRKSRARESSRGTRLARWTNENEKKREETHKEAAWALRRDGIE